jgi:endonuclease-8
MPEGDVVLRAARRLHAALAGRLLTTSDLRWPSLATADLTGREVLEVVARGKHLLIRVDASPNEDGGEHGGRSNQNQCSGQTGRGGGKLTLHSHLRMDGSWHIHRTGEPWRTARPERGIRPEHGIRAILANAEWTAIGHQLGMLDLVATADENTLVGHLGPDILAPDWNEDEAVRRLLTQPEIRVAEALLDQRNLAGLGTLYRTEVLFLRGVHPERPVGTVPDLPELLRLARRIMQANVDRVQQATTGDVRRGQEHWVYGRDRKPCRRCRTTIQRGKLGPPTQERDVYWCPHCQPERS